MRLCFLLGCLLLLLVAPSVAAAPKSPSAMPTKRPPDAEVGARLWKQSCWQCHGTTGAGDGPAASAMVGGVPTLAGKIRGEDFDDLVKIVQDGRGRMPAYKEDIDKHDSRRILVYLRDVLEGKVDPEAKAKKSKAAEDSGDDAEPAGEDAR